MMQFFKQINRKLNIIKIAVLGTVLSFPFQAIALPEREVVAKLQNIPLFGIVNEHNQLNSYLFVNPQQALDLYAQLQNSDPQRANNLEVRPFALSEVYQRLQSIQNQNQELPELIVPDQNSLDQATNLMRANGQSVNDPRTIGIPLFVATIGTGTEERWLIVTNRNNSQPYIPFYFDKNEADQVVAMYKQNNPNLAESVQVRVYALGYVVGLLLGNNNEAVQMMEIIPSQEQVNTANRLLNQ
jgi:hypothetical protein